VETRDYGVEHEADVRLGGHDPSQIALRAPRSQASVGGKGSAEATALTSRANIITLRRARSRLAFTPNLPTFEYPPPNSDRLLGEIVRIRERCAQAIHILDRFHIVAKKDPALDQVRGGQARRLTRDGYEPVLKRTRWCVLKRRTNLTRQQRLPLRDPLRYNLRTARAYLLNEDFQQFSEYESPS
jgi:hypothetical protein